MEHKEGVLNEASVSGPLMKGLRTALEGSVVIKHADRSMIGMPDCSVTWSDHTLWLEFKLFEWKPWMDGHTDAWLAEELVSRASKAAPAQRALMDRLASQSMALYVVWVKKTCVLLADPSGRLPVLWCRSTAQAVDELVDIMHARCQTGN